jgi:hypothetical protein
LAIDCIFKRWNKRNNEEFFYIYFGKEVENLHMAHSQFVNNSCGTKFVLMGMPGILEK